MGTRIFPAFLNLENDPLSLPKLPLQITQKTALVHHDGQKTQSELSLGFLSLKQGGFPPCYLFKTKIILLNQPIFSII